MNIFLKIFIKFVTILLRFYVFGFGCFFFFFFGHKTCGILAPQPVMGPTPLDWEVKSFLIFPLGDEVLTTGPSGKSLFLIPISNRVFPNTYNSIIHLIPCKCIRLPGKGELRLQWNQGC